MKSRILWFSNHTITIEKNSEDELKKNYGRGWVSALEYLLRDKKEYELAIAYPNSKIKEIKKNVYDNRVIYEIPFPNSKIERWIRRFRGALEGQKFLDKYLEIIKDYDPDLIHVFGTENSFGDIVTHTDKPVLVDIQGILSSIVQKWFSSITKREAYKYSTLFSKINFNTHFHHYKTKLKRAEREKKTLSNVKNISGRTTWDRMVTKVLAPNAQYFHCSRVIKDVFWNHDWNQPTEDKLTFLSVMNPDFYKGLDVVFNTCKILKDAGINFTWYIVGITANTDYVKIVSKKLKLKHKNLNIDFLGKTKSEDIAERISKVGFFIHPSYIENSPNSVCEAMITGTPVIASCVGGVPDYIINGETGWMFQEGDYTMLAGIILSLIGNENVGDVAYNGKQTARERHAPEVILKSTIDSYNKLLNEKFEE